MTKLAALFFLQWALAQNPPPPVTPQAESEQQRPEAAAPQIAGTAQEIQVPVILNGLSSSQVSIFPNEMDVSKSTVSSSQILTILKPEMSDSLYSLLSQRLGGVERVSVAELQSSGLIVNFKLDLLVLEVTVPAKDRAQRALDFRQSTPLGPGEEIIQPSTFSGYTNIRSSKTFASRNPNLIEEIRPLQVRLENVQNLSGTYLESFVNYNEFALHPWTRDQVRLSRDFEGSATRASLGDYDLPFVGFQRSLPLGGFLFRRAFDINPDLPMSAAGNFDFYLESPSKVDIYINERFFRQVSLPAGRHNLSNLPLEPGTNNIRLQITDETGRVSFLNFPFISDLDLLDVGTHDFSYAVGLQQRQVDGVIDYNKDQGETGSFYHRYGVGKGLTVGLNAQGDRHQQMYGGDLVFSTPIGLIGLDMATSQLEGQESANAYQLRYRSVFSQRTFLRFSVMHLGERFAPLGTLDPLNNYDSTATGAVSSHLVDLFNFSTGLTYRNHRENLGDSATAFLNLNRTFGRRFNLSLQVSQTRDPVASDARESEETRGFIVASWVDATEGFQTIVNHDTQTRATRADVSYAPRTSDLSFDAGVSHDSRRIDQLNAGFGLERPRYEARIDQFMTLDPLSKVEENTRYDHRTRLSLDTAIAYTGSGVGFARPISDSFAMVTTDGHLKKEVIEVNSTESGAEATTEDGQPAIASQLQSYVVQRVQVQTRNPEATAMLPRDNFVVRPTARSGTGIDLKGESSVMLSGQLVETGEGPASTATFKYLTGSIVPVEEAKAAKDTRYFFTNEAGVFFIESVPPGVFHLKLDGYNGELELTVPDSLFGPYDLGPLPFDATKESQQ